MTLPLTTTLWLATKGSRTDIVRIALTAFGAAAGVIAVFSAATVAAIGSDDGPYSTEVLIQPGLRPGVISALLLLCFPILAFVGQCARIGAPARDRRLAGIRLAGGTPADTVRIACGEAGLAAAAGAVVGLASFLVLRILLDAPERGPYLSYETVDRGGLLRMPSVGIVRPLPTDVRLPLWAMAVIVVAIPVAALAFTRLALRRVTISPLGVSRRRPPRPPRVLPAACFLVGTAGLATVTAIIRALDVSPGDPVFLLVVLALFLLTSAGLVLGIAALAAMVGRFVAARTGGPALLIAARRLVADPFGASRAYGALVLTVLVGAGAQGARAYILAVTDPSETFYRDTLDLVNLVIVVAVVVAAMGLLVVAAEGIVSRRRALAALIAAGTPVRVLRRAVVAQSILPLVFTVPLAAAAGLLAARGFFGASYEQELPGAVPASGVLPTEVLPVLVPWAALGVLVVGTLLVAAVLSAGSLIFLRGSTDQSELRAAA